MKKTILVTGSSRGIGKAIATLAHSKGYQVVVHGSKESKELNEVNKSLSESFKLTFDVADKIATEKSILKFIKENGPIDVLVNNAGIILNYLKDIDEVDDNKAILEWKVNVLGPIHCVQAVLPEMLKQKKGSVINIASMKGYPNYSTMSSFIYSQTKAAVLSMTKSLAKTYSPQGIRFNAVCPGYFLTDISKVWTKETWNRINTGILLGRVGKLEELAQLVLFLASDESSYITGSDYIIDGGYTIQGK